MKLIKQIAVATKIICNKIRLFFGNKKLACNDLSCRNSTPDKKATLSDCEAPSLKTFVIL